MKAMRPFSHPSPVLRPLAVQRRGVVLLIVLVVIVMLALAGYQFTGRMTTERQVAAALVQQSQKRLAARSGADYAMAMVAEGYTWVDLYDSPDLFAEIPFTNADETWTGSAPLDQLQMTLYVNDYDLEQSYSRYGLDNESGRLNLNGLVQLDLSPEVQRGMLMTLPYMEESIADSILDFLDDDIEMRDYGSESDDGTYLVKNGPLDSLDELLALPEVTPWLLYGEDANQNGVLDANEDDGEDSQPLDDADGMLFLGWQRYLTLWSEEQNVASDGTARININMEDVDQLGTDLEGLFGSDIADFVIAFREQAAGNGAQGGSGSSSGGSSSAGGSSGGGSSGSSGVSSGESGVQSGQSNVSSGQSNVSGGGGLSGSSGGSSSGGGGRGGTGGSGGSGGGSLGSAGGAGSATTAGNASGATSSQQAQGVRIQSLFELIDAVVSTDDGELASPLTSSDLGTLELFFDAVATTDQEAILGRIDINSAPREVLLGLQSEETFLSEAAIDQIINFRPWSSPAQLLTDGVVDLETLQQIGPLLTTEGSTYRVQSAGFIPGKGAAVRLESIIRLTADGPQLLRVNELPAIPSSQAQTLLMPLSGAEAE